MLALTSGGQTLAPAGRYGEANTGGWTCYASRGHVYLGVPGGVALDGLTVRAYRDAFGLVDDADAPEGPIDDADELAVPLDYACAFGHIEAWRRHRDRLEAGAAEGRFASQSEASAEATRVASLYADFLFRPQTERGDRIGAPFGTGEWSGQRLGWNRGPHRRRGQYERAQVTPTPPVDDQRDGRLRNPVVGGDDALRLTGPASCPDRHDHVFGELRGTYPCSVRMAPGGDAIVMLSAWVPSRMCSGLTQRRLWQRWRPINGQYP